MATRLPDGTVVMRPPGGRGYPARSGGTAKRVPSVAVGGGPGARGSRVGVTSKQPGRVGAASSSYK